MIDRRNDAKADVGNFELIYRQNIPPTPAYMGLSLEVKGKQITNRANGHISYLGHHRKEKSLQSSQFFKQRSFHTATNISQVHRPMPAFNATEYIEKCMVEMATTSPRSKSVSSISGGISKKSTNSLVRFIPIHKRSKSFNNQIMGHCQAKISCPKSIIDRSLVYPTLKLRRSRGPRLSTNCLAECKDAAKPKFLVASCNHQKPIRNLECNILNTPVLTIRNSVDNIKKFCSPLKTQLQCNKSLSPIIPLKTHINNSKTQLCFGLRAKSEKENNNSNTIHAIGISICNWNNNKGQSSTTKSNV